MSAATNATTHTTSTGIRVRDGNEREDGHHDQPEAEPPRGAQVAGQPTGQQVAEVEQRVGQPAGVEQQVGGGAVQHRGQPPRSQQHGHGDEPGSGWSPDRPVPHHARHDGEGDADHHHPERGREEPGHRREGRDQRQQQCGPPGGPPAPVRLGIGEAEGGMAQPGQRRSGDDDAETTVTPRPAHDRDQRVGGRRHGQQPARRPSGVGEVTHHPQEPPRAPKGQRDGQQQDRRDRGDHAPAQQRGEHREGQDVRRRGHRRALAQGVPRLGVELPEVARPLGCGGQPAAADGADRLARADEHQQHEQRRRRGPPGWSGTERPCRCPPPAPRPRRWW